MSKAFPFESTKGSGWNGSDSGRYGAAMGRTGNRGDPKPGARFYLRHVKLIDGGAYDQGGAYWGQGAPLYYFESEDSEVSGYFRARDRKAAKEHVRAEHAGARFYV